MPDQEEALKKLSEKREDQPRPDFDWRDASEDERAEFFEKMRKQREEAAEKTRDQLTEILLPEQSERLDQIALQQRGMGALMDEKVIKVLKITSEQTEEIKTVNDGMREKIVARMRELGGDRDKMREEFAKVRKEIDEETLAVLTSDQKKKFEEMKGKPFEMPESARGGRGGPGGDRGGFGGGRGGPGGDRGGAGGRCTRPMGSGQP